MDGCVEVLTGLSKLGAHDVERVVAEDLAGGSLLHRGPPARAQEQDDVRVGNLAEQSLEQRGAEEAGRARDGDALAGQRTRNLDHGACLANLSTKW